MWLQNFCKLIWIFYGCEIMATSAFCKNVIKYIICSCSISHNFFAIHNKHNQLGKYHIKTPTILHKNSFYKLLSFHRENEMRIFNLLETRFVQCWTDLNGTIKPCSYIMISILLALINTIKRTLGLPTSKSYKCSS